MKWFSLFLVALSLIALFSSSEAQPAKIPVGAIKKGAEVVGKGIKALNIAATANDVYKFFHHKRKH